jgi:hypothetical protein
MSPISPKTTTSSAAATTAMSASFRRVNSTRAEAMPQTAVAANIPIHAEKWK